MRSPGYLAFAAALLMSLPAFAGGELVVSMWADPNGLDLANRTDNPSLSVGRNIIEPLFGFDEQMQIVPVLAESAQISDDATEYVFKLRHGVTFQDGTPFNAEAAKINLDRIRDPANKLNRRGFLEVVKQIDVVDDYTLKITLSEPFGAFIPTLANPGLGMESPKALETYGADIDRHPVGTGPFEFVSWTTDLVKLKRNDHYWKAGLPILDTLTFRAIPEDGSRVAALQAGEVQFITPVPPQMFPIVQRDNRLEAKSAPSILARYVAMNTMKSPFNDVRVRQAMNYAVDKDAYVKVVMGGYGAPLRSAYPEGLPWYEEQPAYAYNPQKAKELLTAAGYQDGFSTTLWSNSASINTRTDQFLQQQLAQVNVKVTVDAMEGGLLGQKLHAAQNPDDAEVRMAVGGWGTSTGDPDWQLRPLFASTSMLPVLNNTAYYSSPEVDAAIHTGQSTADPDKRATAYATVQAQVWKDAPWIFLGVDVNTWAQSANLSGAYMLADGTLLLESAELH